MFSLHRISRVVIVLAILTTCRSVPAVPQAAEQNADEKPLTLVAEGKRPLLTVTFSSVDRFLSQARYIFDAAEKPEMFERVEGFLENTLNNLEGFNREKPFGIMGYLPVAIPPLPEFVAFVPVDSIDAATKLIEKAPVVIRKDSEEGRYEVIGPNRTFPVLMRDGYAFLPLGDNPSETILEREFPDPAELLSSQAQQFDISARLDVESIPQATRTLLMTLISTGISSQLQQRDGEPEGAYRIRRTEGERGLEALKMLVNDCQKITIGLKVEQTEQAINLDMIIDALEGSKFLKEILASADRPSYFIPLLDDSAAVSLSTSSMMAERDRTAYIEMMEGVKMEVTRLIEEHKLGATPDENSAIGQALSAVQKTLEEGHIDVFAQFYRDADGKLAIVWAGRVQEGDAISAGFQDALARLQNVEELKKAGDLQIGSGQHLGVTFHRLVFGIQPPEAIAVFGKDIGLSVGVGSQAVWGVIGGEGSFDVLMSVMDRLEEATQNPVDRVTPPSFRMIFNVNQLIEFAKSADSAGKEARAAEASAAAEQTAATPANPAPPAQPPAPAVAADGRAGRRDAIARRRERGRNIFIETLAEGDDRIEVDSRLTETGVRTRFRMEEGFVKVFGRLIAAQFMPAQSQPLSATPATPAKP